jgi:hypothetical protein
MGGGALPTPPAPPRPPAEAEEEALCCVCREEERTTAFLPCGHRCACGTCAERWAARARTCPMCRAPVNGLARIFD